MPNLFSDIPNDLPNELFNDLLNNKHIRIERIISHGHTSPDKGWYDQEEHEWVIVLKGEGEIEFGSGNTVKLGVGEYLNIPAHEKHRVVWTTHEEPTLWLAVFYR
ncbi:cupin domain-containing protein [Vibrio superstes]|uniref:Cupin n=1 Tax=Vibrio superstes NBRC 103154 TaxID=1219062 RepID=A0A511QRR8_9VIBR|nr:cupin domain-containing protein [Vibrio superstes]GEM80045.1 cupin [Vibrio superstes NBRC 103154]